MLRFALLRGELDFFAEDFLADFAVFLAIFTFRMS